MKVAIPLFENRVSPHFFTAPELLLVQVDAGAVCFSWRVSLGDMTTALRKTRLLALGPEILLCGGIDGVTKLWLEKQGVRVVDNLMGDAMENLQRYLNQSGS